MTSEKIYKMKDYCTRIMVYIQEYEEVGLAKYNNPRQELYDLIKTATTDESLFLNVAELVGALVRVFNGSGGAFAFPDWIGSKGESFTKEHFINTMKQVWPELFI